MTEFSAGQGDLATRLRTLLDGEVARDSFPGYAFVVGTSTSVVAQGAAGAAVVDPERVPAVLDTIWDVASLTKPLVMAPLVLRAAHEGIIAIHEPVGRWLEGFRSRPHRLRRSPNTKVRPFGAPASRAGRASGLRPAPHFRSSSKEEITWLDLLTHRSGFEAWSPLYARGTGDEAYLRTLGEMPLSYPVGSRVVYSCLGYITAHLALERATGTSVEELARRWIFDPLGVEDAWINPDRSLLPRIAATERDNGQERQMVAAMGLTFDGFRSGVIRGTVDDGNAFHMGGIAGNAGLFATARGVYALACAWLARDPRMLPAAMVELALTNHTPGLEESRGIGWLLRSDASNPIPAGPLSARAFGHTGFTGTSVWIDPERDLVAVLLTNRIHPVARNVNMQTIRRSFHEAIV